MNYSERDLDCMRGVLWERKFRGDGDAAIRDEGAALLAAARDRPYYKTTLLAAAPAPVVWPANPVGWGTYGWKYDPRLVEAALEAGVGIIDTAEGYGFGKVERELGRALRGGVGGTWVASKVARSHLSYAATINAARRSRDRLQIPAIDLYQIHWPVLDKLPQTMDAMAALLAEGTVRAVGVSNFCVGQLGYAQRLAAGRGFSVASNQIRLNELDRGAAAYLVPACRAAGVKVLAHSPLAQGKSITSPVNSLRWVLARGADFVLPSTNNVTHLRENMRASEKSE